MNVFWTPDVKRELRAVHGSIAQNSARYAQGLVDRIARKTELLAQFSHLGAEVLEYENESVRELLEHP